MPKHKRLITAEEFSRFPEDGYQQELIRGVPGVREAPPNFPHGRISGKIYHLLLTFVAPRRLGEVTVESGFLLEANPDTVCAPDVAFVRAEHLPPAEAPPYPAGAPDLVVEVLSPSNRKKQIAEKVARYLYTGARLVWCVDPQLKQITVYRPQHNAVVLNVDDRLSGHDAIPGFECNVADVFDPYSL